VAICLLEYRSVLKRLPQLPQNFSQNRQLFGQLRNDVKLRFVSDRANRQRYLLKSNAMFPAI
jgi:hypothetical protein